MPRTADRVIMTEETLNGVKQWLEMLATCQGSNIRPPMTTTPAALLRDYGQAFPTGPRSQKCEQGEAKKCYMNAGRMALENPEYTYCEGYVVFCGVYIEHAWCVDQGGVVVEPTIRGDVDGYYGIPFTTSYLARVSAHTGVWGVISRTNPSLFESPDPEDFKAEV